MLLKEVRKSMSFSHLYYTCTIGVSHGFQVYAKSSNIDSNTEEDRIIKASAYGLPAHLKRNEATEHEQIIIQQSPTKFAFYKLKSGRYAMTNVTYSGKDYTGRTGNFFADTVVFDRKALQQPKVRPIDYFASQSFKKALNETEAQNPQAVMTDETALEKGYEISYESILSFITLPGNLEKYKALLQAVLGFPTHGKNIIIVDSVENIPKWIAAVQYSLPEKFAWHIPFVTYTHQYDFQHPDAVIYGVAAEETVNQSWYRQFTVFNMVKQNTPLIETGLYVNEVARNFVNGEQQYYEFLRFVDLISIGELEEDVNGIIPLYYFMKNELDHISKDELAQGLERYLQIEDVNVLQKLSDYIVHNVSADENGCNNLYHKLPKKLVTDIALKWLQAGKSHMGMKDLSVQFFYSSWENLMIADHDDRNQAALTKYIDTVIELNKGNEPFHKKGYDMRRLKALQAALLHEPRQSLWEAWIKYTLEHLKENKILDEKILVEQANEQRVWLLNVASLGIELDFNFDEILRISFKDEELVRNFLVTFIEGYYKKQKDVELNKIIQMVATYCERHPETLQFYKSIVIQEQFVKDYLKGQLSVELQQSKQPIMELIGIFARVSNQLQLSDSEKELLIKEAVELLLANNNGHFLSEVQQLVIQSEDGLKWVEMLEPSTNMQLLTTVLQQVLIEPDCKVNIEMIRVLYSLFEGYAKSDFEDVLVEVRQKVSIAENLYELCVTKKLNYIQFMDLMGVLKNQQRDFVVPILQARLTHLAQFVNLKQTTPKAFYELISPELLDEYISIVESLVKSDPQSEGLANYIFYMQTVEGDLPKSIHKVLEDKKIRTNVIGQLKKSRKSLVEDYIKEQLPKKSFGEKISQKFSFFGSKKNKEEQQ